MTSTFLGRLSPSERERLLSSLSPDVSAAVVAHLKHLSMTDHQSEATRFDVTSDASDASDASDGRRFRLGGFGGPAFGPLAAAERARAALTAASRAASSTCRHANPNAVVSALGRAYL